MLTGLPFLFVAGVLLPVLAWRSRAGLDLAEPGPGLARVAAGQALAVQAVLGLLAALALAGGEVAVAWGARLTPGTGGAAVGLVVLALLVAWVNARLDRGPENGLRRMLRNVPLSDPMWLAVLLAAAVVEEFAYRGVLTSLLGSLDIPGPAVVSAVLFGLAHGAQGVRGIALSAVFALALQWLVHLSGGLALAILAHITYDLGARALARTLPAPTAPNGSTP